jgi:hypothetical protein
MKKIRILVLIISFFSFYYCSTPVVKKIETSKNETSITKNGEVIAKLNRVWEDKFISAKGSSPIPPGQIDDGVGRKLAHDAALNECYLNLGRQISGVKLYGEITVLNCVTKSYSNTSIQTIVNGAKIIEDRWDPDKKEYVISMDIKYTELVKYVKEWIDNGIINPDDLDRGLQKF